MKPWNSCGELLSLFAIPSSYGSLTFADLCDLGAVLLRFTSDYNISELARAQMRQQGRSPLIYWANMKRSVRPLFDAGTDTLEALGLPLGGKMPSSCLGLAEAVATAMVPDVDPCDLEIYSDLVHILEAMRNG